MQGRASGLAGLDGLGSVNRLCTLVSTAATVITGDLHDKQLCSAPAEAVMPFLHPVQ